MELSFKGLKKLKLIQLTRVVLILILMELSFKEHFQNLLMPLFYSFNPYFNGTFF